MTFAGFVLGWPQVIVLLVALQRLIELAVVRRNTAHLLAQGGVEIGAGHYPLFIVLHAAWMIALFVLVPADAATSLPLLCLFALLQLGRLWVVASLGRYWTTRIITVPGAPVIRRGPYRFLRHPNYLVVIGEIAVLPLAFGQWQLALLFSALNAALIFWRIRVEDRALNPRRSLG
jgi:methyltransferase